MKKDKKKGTTQLHFFVLSGPSPILDGEVIKIQKNRLHILLWDELKDEHRRFILQNILNRDADFMSSSRVAYISDYLVSCGFFQEHTVFTRPFCDEPHQTCMCINPRLIGAIHVHFPYDHHFYFIDGQDEQSHLCRHNTQYFNGEVQSLIREIKAKKGIKDVGIMTEENN